MTSGVVISIDKRSEHDRKGKILVILIKYFSMMFVKKWL